MMTTEMTNEELSRAVAERLGWEWLGEDPRLWMNPATGEWEDPKFAESMDACLAPGGPVEWLRWKKLLWSDYQLAVGGFLSVIQELPELHNGERWAVVHDAEADTLPRAFCLAFLRATDDGGAA